MTEEEAALFGDELDTFKWPVFEIDSAYQGREGLALIERSILDARPYALAFIDVRMPPGWDAGMNDYLSKPVLLPELRAALERGLWDWASSQGSLKR